MVSISSFSWMLSGFSFRHLGSCNEGEILPPGKHIFPRQRLNYMSQHAPHTIGGGHHNSCQPMALCRDLWLVSCTAAVVNGNRGLLRSMSWTAGRGSLSPLPRSHMVSWQPISALRPPLCLAPKLPFARSGFLSAAAGGGGEMEREEGSGDRAGGRGGEGQAQRGKE